MTTLTITTLTVDEDGYDEYGAYYGAGQNGCLWRLEGVFGTRSGFTPRRLNRDTRAEAYCDAVVALPAAHRGDRITVSDETDEANVVS